MSVSELGPLPDIAGYDKATVLDSEDRLSGYRDRFIVNDPNLIYLDGNSLGRLPKAAVELIDDVRDRQWGERLIRSWNEGWWNLQIEIGDKIAGIMGAQAGEVIVSDSTSVNLYKLASAVVEATPGRSKIVTDDLNFPSDVYILDGIARRYGLELEIVSSDGINGPVERLIETIDDQTALVSLSHTVFVSGYTYDMERINNAAYKCGALSVWDLSHSAGSVPVDLDASGSKLAIGCTYKHLHGGPGSPAFLYVAADLQDQLSNPIQGWWSHEEPFALDLDFRPVDGIRRFHTGTMPILSLAAMEPGVDLVIEAGIGPIREKSIALGDYFIDLWRKHLAPLGFGLSSPAEPNLRGSHVALTHSDGYAMTRALIEKADVIPDFRSPDVLRFGLSPLYTTFAEVHEAVRRLGEIVEDGTYEEFDGARLEVT